ncbi:MAG: amidohydrolase family protein [Bacteroidota bacterium]
MTLTIEKTIYAYTINAACTMRRENKIGSIEVGKEADLITPKRNILEIPPVQIKQTVVEETYLLGQLVDQL